MDEVMQSAVERDSARRAAGERGCVPRRRDRAQGWVVSSASRVVAFVPLTAPSAMPCAAPPSRAWRRRAQRCARSCSDSGSGIWTMAACVACDVRRPRGSCRSGPNAAGMRACRRQSSGGLRMGLSSSAENWDMLTLPVRNLDEVARTKVVVAGGGSFGTAMANQFAMNGYPVTLFVRKAHVAEEINTQHRNMTFFPDFELPENITATCDPVEAFADAKLVVHAIPVQVTRAFLVEHQQHFPKNVPILCTSKGLEVRELKLMCDLIPEMVGRSHPVAYLSGPSFAREMMQSLPTAVVVASKDHRFAQRLAAMLSSPSFRVFTSKDVVGLEVAGATKNVVAIAAGICEGLGLGMNSMAALVTRGCSEMRRLAVEKGGSAVTLAGLSGVGDTFLTCFGPLSRNRTVGVRLGKGESLEEILATSREVAEGVETASALVRWLARGRQNSNIYASRACVKYPILFGVAAILEGRITPNEGMQQLLAMPPREED
ncbi:Glycerol-3-phosphate dehydrogenase NAD(+) 2, chloroplastic [Porphyridium purpureum]|uniref:Glycerol-3-phosphate dehydrogenase [NAD(+)] n=1 Tax=Porphyridium purpureum TaxID=35688 RepID=A0A5J4YX70_PORPP|nr:Glycerol-3-phosphate dehydrogenase NAD(+) 2, chloroplastic [Porphyridium purpureum]|eukprot:POR9821..scf227_4